MHRAATRCVHVVQEVRKRNRKTQQQKSWRHKKAKNREHLNRVRNNFESKIQQQLVDNKINFDYESLLVQYKLIKHYKPDFILCNNNIIIEVKGIFDSDDRKKHLCIKEQHPYLDIRFVFYKDHKLYKGAKSTYTEWCEKHGFKCAVGSIPEEWYEELRSECDENVYSYIHDKDKILTEGELK